jgi:hypothetical protein
VRLLNGTDIRRARNATPATRRAGWIPQSVRTPFRRALAAWALACLAVTLNGTAFADDLKPFEATYDWMWHGMTVAVSTQQLEHQQGDQWVYKSKSEPRGIGRVFSERPTLESVLQVTESGVRPLNYKADDGTSATQRDANVQFDWEHHRAGGVNEDAKVDMPIAQGIQDDQSVQIALMVELLRGHTPDKFSLLSGSSVREYRYSREGEETLTTPVGTLQTVIYRSEKQNSPRVTRFWCAPSLGYIPLRVQQKRKDDVEWTMQIQKLKREP